MYASHFEHVWRCMIRGHDLLGHCPLYSTKPYGGSQLVVLAPNAQ